MPRTVALLSQGATLPVLGWNGLTGQRQVALGPQGGGVEGLGYSPSSGPAASQLHGRPGVQWG